MRLAIPPLLAILALAACSSRPDQIAPAYVAPETFAASDCAGLTARRDEFHVNLVRAERQYARARDHDTGGVIMWGVFYQPTAPKMVPQIAALKGNLQAVNARALQTGCQMGTPPEVPEDPAPPRTPSSTGAPDY